MQKSRASPGIMLGNWMVHFPEMKSTGKLGQVSANFFLKGQRVNVLGFVSQVVSATTTQLLL